MNAARLLPIGRASFGIFALSLVLATRGGAAPPQAAAPAPRVERPVFPDPPEQGRPWAAPETRLPRFLIAATSLLFEQGVADPRGCEYREVEINDPRPVATHAFVLPEKPGEARRFAVGWDGLVYPASTIGKPADLETDIRTLTAALQKGREDAEAKQPARFRNRGGFTGMTGRAFIPLFSASGGAAAVETPSAVKVCMLLRLGRTDLAETLFAGGTTWKPGAGRDLTDYRISYQTLAVEWADRVYNRAVDAHGRGEDEVALDAARRVAAFTRAAVAKLKELSFPLPRPVGIMLRPDAPPSYFSDLRQLPEFLADQERRAKEPPRTPIPGPDAPAAARVAALIRDLDEAPDSGMSMNGSAAPGGPVLTALVKEGDAAVEPLLAVLESDNRLTRTVGYPGSRHGADDRYVMYVHQAARSVLLAILKNRVIPNMPRSIGGNELEIRKREAEAIRAYWTKVRGVPEPERYYRTLADDAATPAEWLDAAQALTQPADVSGRGGSSTIPDRPGGKVPPLRGEPLRNRQDPSVTALMARRVESIARQRANLGPSEQSQARDANLMAGFLAGWDPKGALPTLRERVVRCVAITEKARPGASLDDGLHADIARLTLLRQAAGDPRALDDYAAWVRTITPPQSGFFPSQVFEPLWRNPAHPAIAGAAEALFADPKSPWVVALLARVSDRTGLNAMSDLIVSPLLGVAPFRQLVLDALALKTEIGSVETDDSGTITVRLGRSSQRPEPPKDDPLRPAPGSRMPVRLADHYAATLQDLGGLARFAMYWPEPKRDALIADCAAFLRQYGARFAYRAPAGTPREPRLTDSWHQRAVLTFDPLDHPATPDDVREGKALFSLDAAERRRWPLPSFPLSARWTTLEIADDDPGLRRFGNAVKRPRAQIEYLQSGTVWQAEEAREDGRWRRYYGFVGRHVLARVPAEEIEFPAPRNTEWYPVAAGLDGRLIPPGAFDDGTRLVHRDAAPTGPLVVEAWLRNRRGIDTPAPADGARTAGDLSLREGLTLRLFRAPEPPVTGQIPAPAPPAEQEIPAREVRRHRGGEPAPVLAPTATVRLLRVDLRALFPVEAPGRYRLEVASDDFEPREGRPGKLAAYFNVP